MFDDIQALDNAIEFILEKATSNPRSHALAASMTQEEHDQHVDALEHHLGAIHHYRSKPEVQAILGDIANKLVPLRTYFNKSLKFENKDAPYVDVDDLNLEHPNIKGKSAGHIASIISATNNDLKNAHSKFHANKDIKALSEHSRRFLAHMASMLEWHGVQAKGEGTHHKFFSNVTGPELHGQTEEAKYRGHSSIPRPDGSVKVRTQSITKQNGSNWHPGLPELISLEEHHLHPSAGKMKEMYPFHEIKVNGAPLKAKSFSEDAPPELIHDRDYYTNLTSKHKVKYPDGSVKDAIGGYHGTKSISSVMTREEQAKTLKKTNSCVCAYFPEVSIAHFIVAENFLKVMNPYTDMDDEQFGDYVVSSMSKSLGHSEQSVILAEAMDRLEKAKNTKKDEDPLKHIAQFKVPDHHRRQGIQDVLSGKIAPMPIVEEAAPRTEKDDEERDELEDVSHTWGNRKRSPFIAPADVFTDEDGTKIDPEKYKKWVEGDMTEQDLRNENAVYHKLVLSHPDAQKRHKQYVDIFRDRAQEGLSRYRTPDESETETPHKDHAAVLKQASQDLADEKITSEDYTKIVHESAKRKAAATKGKIKRADLSEGQKAIMEADPSYQPQRPGVSGNVERRSEKDLTELAHGKIPEKMLANKDDFGAGDAFDDEDSEETSDDIGDDEPSDDREAQAREMTAAGEDQHPTGSITRSASAIDLINTHPGFSAYLKMKEHLLSQYKDPEVRRYMEDKIVQHENDEHIDPAKLAGVFHVLHNAHARATKHAAGEVKLLADVMKESPATEGESAKTEQMLGSTRSTASVPETLMTPEQRARFQDVKKEKAVASASQVPAVTEPVAAPAPAKATAPKTVIRRAKQS